MFLAATIGISRIVLVQLADFVIGKPGPGSLAEALAMGLPVIVERNAWTLPQERYNTEWVREKQVGLVLKKFSGIASAVEELLAPQTFERLRSNCQMIDNQAFLEIVPIFQQILGTGRRLTFQASLREQAAPNRS